MADVVQRTITRVLVANRGEIARRVFQTATEMGISTVAVYADGDADAPFVKDADTAIALRGRTATETYLNVDKVLDAARRSGADAIHPGYGFLSENADFASAVEAAGLVWIGPPPEAIAAMGDKLSAKELMRAADVPTLPARELGPDADVLEAAAAVGYPLLIKASAGGGGRGMRVVREESELDSATSGARREAANAFGDDTIFMERWLPACRHVEIQILGDQHGNLLHCFERECSIQRRHQKVIEEAPSSAVTEVIRERMGQAAVAAGKQLGYYSAGTVEFLLDGDDFWFLEVNTRLQVEHPVTEEITGLDLVREQLRIAEGESLGYEQDDLSIHGHAIEARLYAENAQKNFLPSPGTVALWEPSERVDARYDSGIESGSVIGTEFDPMLAKVIVHAPTRREAALRLARALETTRLNGMISNRDFLVATLRTPEFLAGDTTTDFIDRVNPERVRALSDQALFDACLCALFEAQARRRSEAMVLGSLRSGWRNSVMPPQRVSFSVAGREIDVSYTSRRDGGFDVSIDSVSCDVRVVLAGAGLLDLDIDGRRVQAKADCFGERWFVHHSDGDIELLELPTFSVPGAGAFEGGLLAPMPGKVLATHVAAGEGVEKGQLLLILEAMKMEHRITAPVSGTVSELPVSEGDQVTNGQLLVVLLE
jgi:propionyl-CoA carboxylase alpha chain